MVCTRSADRCVPSRALSRCVTKEGMFSNRLKTPRTAGQRDSRTRWTQVGQMIGYRPCANNAAPPAATLRSLHFPVSSMAEYRVLLTDYAWPDLEIEKAVLADVDAELVLPKATDEDSLTAAATGVDAIMTN